MNFTNMKMATKLYLGFGLIVAILVLLLTAAYTNFNKLVEANRWNLHTYEVIGEVDSILESLINMETGARGFSLTGLESSLEPTKAGQEAFKKHLEKAKSLTSDNPQQQTRLQAVADDEQDWFKNAIEPVLTIRRDVTDGKEKMEAVVAFEQAGKGKQAMDRMRAKLAEISDAESSLLEQRTKDSSALQALTANVLIFGGAIVAVLAMFIAWLITTLVTRQIGGEPQYARDVVAKVGEGDLTVDIETRANDKSSLLFEMKQMVSKLAQVVTHVNGGAHALASASAQVNSTAQSLSQAASEQAAGVEETSASIEQMTASIAQNTENA